VLTPESGATAGSGWVRVSCGLAASQLYWLTLYCRWPGRAIRRRPSKNCFHRGAKTPLGVPTRTA